MKRQEATFSVRTTIIIIVLLSSVFLSLLVYFVANVVLLQSFLEIERQNTEASLRHVNDIFDEQLTQLETMLHDWASWDDTYQFIQDRNAAYIQSTLGDTTLENLGLDAVVYVDSQGQIVYSKTLGQGSRAQEAERHLVEHIQQHEELLRHDSAESAIQGLIQLPEGQMMIAARPIMMSDEQSPIIGTLLFAYYVTDDRIAEISDQAHFSVDIYPYNLETLPDDVRIARAELAARAGYYVRPLSEEVVAGYVTLYDIYGEPLLILRVHTDRPVYMQGRYIFQVFTVTLGMSIVFFGLLIIFLLERYVIKRLALLDRQVAQITETKNLSLRVATGRNDEIGKLANSVNRMVSELSALQGLERAAKEEAASANDKLSASLDEMQKVNRLMVGRELKMIEMKKELAKLQKRTGTV